MTLMTLQGMIDYNRRWAELHKDNRYQAEAVRHMTAMIDKIDQLRTDAAVARVAQAIGEWTPEDWANPDFWEDREFWTAKARTGIAALLGDES